MDYLGTPRRSVRVGSGSVACFLDPEEENIDPGTVAAFGAEWEKFDRFDEAEIEAVGDKYFDIVTPGMMNRGVEALDLGCGSGRWTRYLSRRVLRVEAVDPSAAVFRAAAVHADLDNARWTEAGVAGLPFRDGSFDLVVSLGVLHHVPDTALAVRQAVAKLKPGGWFLVYLYYAFDNRGRWFKAIHRASDLLRKVISRLPYPVKAVVCEVIAVLVYVPLAWGVARALKRLCPGRDWWKRAPLSFYHDRSLRVIRNDALDRFGTLLEQRFTRTQVEAMMHAAGLTDIVFSDHAPYWHAAGRKAE